MDQSKGKVTLKGIRKLTAVKQNLASDPEGKNTQEKIISTIRNTVFTQWDPIEVVAPSHVLSLWNRVPGFSRNDLDNLLWDQKLLFKHWMNRTACLVLIEDYPLYYTLMKEYPNARGTSWGSKMEEARNFMSKHEELGKSILKQLEHGPKKLTEFNEYVKKKSPDGWSTGSDVSTMLFHLELSGKVMVTGQSGIINIWGLPEQYLPSDIQRKVLKPRELEKECARRAISAMGTASLPEINYYFPRARYSELKGAIQDLEKESVIVPVKLNEIRERGSRYMLRDDLSLLESLNHTDKEMQISLLPPFDNFICGRARTNRVFGFDYNHEMFLPKAKRKHGYYVMPILCDGELIGRIDPVFDKENCKLVINSVHAEPGAPHDAVTGERIALRIQELGSFLGADVLEYTEDIPAFWKDSIQ